MVIKYYIVTASKKIFTLLPYFIIGLILIYFVADILTSKQTYHDNADRTIAKFLLIALLCVSLVSSIFIFFYYKKYKELKIWAYLLFVLLLIISILPVIRDLIDKKIDSNSFTLLMYPLSFLSVALFYFLYPLKKMSINIMKIFYYIILFVTLFFMIFYYFKVQATPLASLNYRKAIYSHIYIIIGLFPLTFLLFSKIEVFINLNIFILAVLMSDKGTPLISLLLLLLIFAINKLVKKPRIIYIILGAILSAVFVLFIVDVFILNLKIFGRFLDQSTYIRIDGYRKIFEEIKTFSIKELLIGKGTSAVIGLRRLAAHNDYLEYLYDYGIVGFIPFLSFIILTVVLSIRNCKRNRQLTMMGVSFLIVMIPITLFSALFTNTNLFLFVCVGLMLRDDFSNFIYSFKRKVYITYETISI